MNLLADLGFPDEPIPEAFDASLFIPRSTAPVDFIPRPYQADMIRIMTTPADQDMERLAGMSDHIPIRALVAAQVGCGKTVTTLTAFRHLRDHGFIQSALIVGPLKVILSTWPEEVAKWSHTRDLKMSVIHGTGKEKSWAIAPGYDLYATNFDNLSFLFEATGGFAPGALPFDALIIDESTGFKNFKAQRTELVKELLRLNYFKWVVLLTATPIPNGLDDLFSQMYLLDGGYRLGHTLKSFREVYCTSKPMSSWQTFYVPDKNAGPIYERTKDIIHVYRTKDHISMPRHNVVEEPYILSDKARRIYDAVSKMAALTHEDIWEIAERKETENSSLSIDDDLSLTADGGAALYNLLLQICTGTVYLRQEEYTPENWEKLKILFGSTDDRATVKLHNDQSQALDLLLDQIGQEKVMLAYRYRHERDGALEVIRKRQRKGTKLTGAAFVGSSTGPNEFRSILDQWRHGDLQYLLFHPACLHPDTEVLTERGWLPIVQVRRDDRVYDGVELVAHDGCSYSGVQPVVSRYGILMTREHKLFIDGEWRKASDLPGPTFCRPSEVYDLVNCGPRHCFVIRNRDGETFLSHNSMAHGVNAQGSEMRHFVFLSPLDNSEHVTQSFGRIYRPGGATDEITEITLFAKGTIQETDVLPRIKHKIERQNKFLDMNV